LRQKTSTILIISSEKHSQTLLKSIFTKEGYSTDTAYDARNALLKSNHNHYGLIIIDHLATGFTNIQLCMMIRKKIKTPILLITEQGNEDQRLAAFEAGADDCMEKPLSYKELIWRANAILKRSSIQAYQPRNRNDFLPLHLKKLIIDPSAHRIVVEGKELHLPLKEFDLLYYLVLHAGVVHSRLQLLEVVWQQTEANDYRTVDTHIKRLREKLTIVSPEVGSMIKTVWSVGYLFRDYNNDLYQVE
jgi:two-component system response regulator ResD